MLIPKFAAKIHIFFDICKFYGIICSKNTHFYLFLFAFLPTQHDLSRERLINIYSCH